MPPKTCMIVGSGGGELWKLPSSCQVSSSSNEERTSLRSSLRSSNNLPLPWGSRCTLLAVFYKTVLLSQLLILTDLAKVSLRMVNE